MSACELCTAVGGDLLWQGERCRVVLLNSVDSAEARDYPGFCRVIWRKHVREMTDLSLDDRRYFMDVVFAVESVLRACVRPDKINLASLGNMTPHLHWHVIPRFAEDCNFPAPIWAARQRASSEPLYISQTMDSKSLRELICTALSGQPKGEIGEI